MKIASSHLASVFLCVALGGCGDDDGSSRETSSDSNSTAGETQASNATAGPTETQTPDASSSSSSEGGSTTQTLGSESDSSEDTADPGNELLERHVANLSYVDVVGHDLAYLDVGDESAPAVVFVHGIPTSSFLFRDVAPKLADAGYRVLALDMLGYGQSDKPALDDGYSIDAQATRVFDFADAVGVETFSLVVHDIGGFIGWSMLGQQPERLESLVVTNTVSSPVGLTVNELTLMHFGPKAPLTPQEVWSQLDDPGFAEMAARSFLEQGLFDDDLATPSLVQAYAQPLTSGSSSAFIGFFESIGPELAPEAVAERQALFQSYSGDVALVFGEEDAFFDAAVHVPLFVEDFGIAEANTTVVPDVGHYVQEEDPQVYADGIVRFLDR